MQRKYRQRAFPPSPTMDSCRTARTTAWWRLTAPSSGCASPGRTPPASSPRCWTARPATSASGPAGTMVPHQRRYIPGTMVLETTWHTPNGWLLVQDFLVMRAYGRRRAAPRLPACPGRRRRPAGTLLRAGHLHRGPCRGRGQRGAGLRVRDADRDVGLRRRRLQLHDRLPACRVTRSYRDVVPAPRAPPAPVVTAAPPCEGRVRLRRSVVGRAGADHRGRGARANSTTPSPTGGTGSPTAPSPTIPGAATWSAAP